MNKMQLRRTIFKATILGVLSTIIPSRVRRAEAENIPQEITPSFIDEGLKIVAASDCLDEIKILVESAGFVFGLNPESVKSAEQFGDYLGLHVTQIPKTQNSHIGMELAFTIDRKSSVLVFSQVLKIWCLPFSFENISTFLYGALPKIEFIAQDKEGNHLRTFLKTPIVGTDWSFVTSDDVPLRPIEFVKEGWAPELEDAPRWKYKQSHQPKFIEQEKLQLFRFEEVEIEHKNQSDITLTLDYPDLPINPSE